MRARVVSHVPTGDTIAALAGPAPGGRRLLLRISGPDTAAVLHRLTTPPTPNDTAPAPALERGTLNAALHAGFAAPLPARVLRFAAPRSFTGEDAAELLLPANPTIAERALDLVLATPGVRLALPGEFTARAYLNDRLTLEQAEGVGALIAANSEADLAAAQSLLSGSTGTRYAAWGDRLARLLALVEAGIDFSDQEAVVPITAADLHRELTALCAEITALIAPSTREQRTTLPLVMLVGAPNAGKSTLFNALLGHRRAVVSATAGTTRDVIVEETDLIPHAGTLDAVRVRLADSAGVDEPAATAFTDPRTSKSFFQKVAQASRLCGTPMFSATGETPVPPDSCFETASTPVAADLGQARTRDALTDADVLVHCDPTGRFSMPLPQHATIIRVRTKGDLPHGSGAEHLAVCALDGWNLSTLKRTIADLAATHARGTPNTRSIVIPRHDRLLRQAAATIIAALELIPAAGRALPNAELIANTLRATLDTLSELTGRISPDDVLGRIFATFCIGK
jgi:tRNA modification GTPase